MSYNMVYDIQKIKKTREMRLSGLSLSEIKRETGIPVSTLSIWFRDITLTKQQIDNMNIRVSKRVSRGRLNSLITVKSKRAFMEKTIIDEATKEFKGFVNQPLFITGLSLYWSSGTKRGSAFQFSSSDINMINIMIMWLNRYMRVDEEVIKIRNYDKYSRIDVSRINVLRKVIAWQKLLIKYYDEEVI
jgi:hypothetical protein